MDIPYRKQTIIQYQSGQSSTLESAIIVERPVTLTVNGSPWLTLMCTPVDLEALAVGFLYNEGLIQSRSELESVRLCPTGDNVDVWLNRAVEKPQSWRRTTGCTGGVTSVVESLSRPVKADNGSPLLSSDQVGDLIGRLFEAQELYRISGGVHTSGLSDGLTISPVAEDIGRHNTLDKLAGRCLMDEIPLARRKVLLTTGRISSEMLQKAGRMGAVIVISRTSPTSMSVEMAEALGISLIGYARRNRFNLYTCPERIRLLPEPPGEQHTGDIPPQNQGAFR